LRGIEFRFPDSHDFNLDRLFRHINLDNYDWYICEHEIIKDDKNMAISEFIDSKGFNEIISEESLIILVNIQAYPKGAERITLEVYEDFKNSACEIIFLITDVNFVEIYAKNKGIIMQFIENAVQCGCENILIKTDKDDGRTRLSVI
jgi:Protein of unknown function (DUF2691).